MYSKLDREILIKSKTLNLLESYNIPVIKFLFVANKSQKKNILKNYQNVI